MEAEVGNPRARLPITTTDVPVGHAASPRDFSSPPLPGSEWMLSQVRGTPASPFSFNRSDEADSGCASMESAAQVLNICGVLDVDEGHASSSPCIINSVSRDKCIQRHVQSAWLDGDDLILRKSPKAGGSSGDVSSMFGAKERVYQSIDYLSTPAQAPPSLAACLAIATLDE